MIIKNSAFTCILIFLISCAKTNLQPQKDIDLVSFHRGFLMWDEDLKCEKIPYNAEQLINGIRAAAKGEKLSINEEELARIVQQFQEELVAKKKEENLAEAEAFLQNISKKAIELVPSKLYIKKLSEGNGKMVAYKDAPFVVYNIKTLEDGKEIEIFSSENSPIQISLPDTIPGFVEGVVGMREGERRILYIHPVLTKNNYSLLPNKILIIDVQIDSLN